MYTHTSMLANGFIHGVLMSSANAIWILSAWVLSQGWFGDPRSQEDRRGLKKKLVYFPLNPLQFSRDLLITKSTLTVMFFLKWTLTVMLPAWFFSYLLHEDIAIFPIFFWKNMVKLDIFLSILIYIPYLLFTFFYETSSFSVKTTNFTKITQIFGKETEFSF